MTVHSAFNFKFGKNDAPISDAKLDEFRSNLHDLRLIIIDELSMIDSDMLCRLNSRLMKIFRSEDIFGGKSVVLVGDLLQLPQFKGQYIFSNPKNSMFICHKGEGGISKIWREFEYVALHHNHRQGEGSTWADTLNRIRIGQLTEEDETLLRSRIISADDPSYPQDACHVFTRMQRSAINVVFSVVINGTFLYLIGNITQRTYDQSVGIYFVYLACYLYSP